MKLQHKVQEMMQSPNDIGNLRKYLWHVHSKSIEEPALFSTLKLAANLKIIKDTMEQWKRKETSEDPLKYSCN